MRGVCCIVFTLLFMSCLPIIASAGNIGQDYIPVAVQTCDDSARCYNDFHLCIDTLYGPTPDGQSSLVGRVVDCKTGLGLSGATIRINDSQTALKCDSAGIFVLDSLMAGAIAIFARVIGYQAVLIENIAIPPQAIMNVTIHLKPCAVPIHHDFTVMAKRKAVDFCGFSGFPLEGYLDPLITADYETGWPLFNVISVADYMGIFIDSCGPLETNYLIEFLRITNTSTIYDGSRETLQFEYSDYWSISRVINGTLPVIDNIDKRRIEREAIIDPDADDRYIKK